MSIETSSKTTPIKKNHTVHIYHGSPDTSNQKQKSSKINENNALQVKSISMDEKKSNTRKNPDDIKSVSND